MRNGGTAPSGPLWLLRLGTLAMALVLSAHVESAAGLQAGNQSWTTAPDYRVYDPAATDSGFGRFSRMRVGETWNPCRRQARGDRGCHTGLENLRFLTGGEVALDSGCGGFAGRIRPAHRRTSGCRWLLGKMQRGVVVVLS